MNLTLTLCSAEDFRLPRYTYIPSYEQTLYEAVAIYFHLVGFLIRR